MRRHLAGRRLTEKEIPFSKDILEAHEQAGYLKQSPGIIVNGSYTQCQRCGNQTSSLFGYYQSPLFSSDICYCRHCLALGKISSTTSLYSWNASPPSYTIPAAPLTWQGTLSKGQQHASDRVIQAIQNRTSLLVWAVCGSGKTEVLFKGVETALLEGKRVLIATPRTDVVKELAPRFEHVFPEVTLSALYGGQTKVNPTAPLIIATTHQVLRFYQAFDVVIVDEVDAFPYTYDESLQYGVKQAQKENASMILLSATPSKALRETPHLQVTRIARRYHGFDLPVPRLEWCGPWHKKVLKERLPSTIFNWIADHHQHNAPALVFVPSIRVLHQISSILQKKNISHAAVHSASTDRHQHVEAFRQSKIPIVLTTTILERGITIPKVDIAVIGAEADLFTESALVQMAGRVGRHKDFPTGDVVFFHYGKTRAMRNAVDHIKKMNAEEMDH
ncbi:DEAD/DEAH box helicase [Alkalicoccobacillus gibsonii]|uniref:DEAD/DEAH box helicase n=1 Tax=Alkalicoccobacillus gibsonii TaxID=79881 RepID=UPI0019328E34|nr:DEAD/DEAH box helicase [Alkalicoccobacillus gibsonii]MBM0066102.1 DEAD/DEAH box helicase [Alkalicoccobacillus gibsonii]